MFIADGWKDYELIDTGDGERLERWGKYLLRRPDPQVIWPPKANPELWDKIHAHYHRSSNGGGSWEARLQLPERWTIYYRDLAFYIKPMGFKHTGLFPEQASNWEWLSSQIKSRAGQAKILNLFAYTGGATLAAAQAGAAVCHIDAAKGMVTWAKENLLLSGMIDRPVRFIVDDVLKFVQREKRREHQYDGIIMDPPSFGRGPNGEIWKIEEELYGLVIECMKVLTPNPLFFLINSYTTGLAPTVLKNILCLTMGEKFRGQVTADEIGLPVFIRINIALRRFRPLEGYLMKNVVPGLLYEDNHLLVVEKPVNIPSQRDESDDPDLLSILKEDLKCRYQKPGEVYLGLVHRLDRPVGGVMVFAKTSKAAARLSAQIRTGEFKKTYLAIVHGLPESAQGSLRHLLLKDHRLNKVFTVSQPKPEAKEAILEYEVKAHLNGMSLLRINLQTGRSHQIRVQFAAIGHPLYGDQKYGPQYNKPGQQIALWATEISCIHPTKNEIVTFQSLPPDSYPWECFKLRLD